MAISVMGIGVLDAARRGVKGYVESVFNNSAHLLSDDLFITLGSATTAIHPYSLTISCLPQGITIGQKFTLTLNSLSIEPYFDHSLKNTKIFAPIKAAPFNMVPEKISYGLELAKQRAKMISSRGGFHFLLNPNAESDFSTRSVLPHLQNALAAIRSDNWRQFCKYATNMSGVGPGLTPSGDDLLAGMIAALGFYQKSTGQGPAEHQLIALAAMAAKNTTPFSGFLLKSAAKGLISEAASDWLNALFTGYFSTLMQAQQTLLNFGHSSGIDILVGMIFALQSIMALQLKERNT